MCRLAYYMEHDYEMLRDIDGKWTTEEAFLFFSPKDFRAIYEYFFASWSATPALAASLFLPLRHADMPQEAPDRPDTRSAASQPLSGYPRPRPSPARRPEDCPPKGNKAMRVAVFKKWSETAGTIVPQPSAIKNTSSLKNWIIDSRNGTVAPKGFTLERVLGLTNMYFSQLDPAAHADHPQVNPRNISKSILTELGKRSAGGQFANVFSASIARGDDMGKHSIKYLSAVLDNLPPALQAALITFEIATSTSPLVVGSATYNSSVEILWDSVEARPLSFYPPRQRRGALGLVG